MSDHFRTIYGQRAADYDALVSHEDYAGNLLPALRSIVPLAQTAVVEFGAGTGRVTRLLSPLVGQIIAADASPHMLLQAVRRQAGQPGRVAFIAGDNRQMPVRGGLADVAIAGWTFAQLCGWYPETWPYETDLAVNELLRVLKPGGTAIIIETQGTGRETPQPPAPHLAAFYRRLEDHHGFQFTWVRTDYRFESPEQTDRLIRFFFGDEMANRFRGAVIVPECTGIWWRQP
ncbi:MAG: class I SAM-dependent methyltransferase [Chloroflexota bacterium]